MLNLIAPISAELLDIGYTSNAQALSLRMLFTVQQTTNVSGIRGLLAAGMNQLQLPYTVTAWAAELDEHWDISAGQADYKVTLLSRLLTATQVRDVVEIAEGFDLNVTGIRRLTTLQVTEDKQNNPVAGVEISLSLMSRPETSAEAWADNHLAELRKALRVIANADVALQQSVKADSVRGLAVFDMDSTLIQTEVIDELAALVGCSAEVSAITERAMAGELDFKQSLSKRVAMLKGLALDDIQNIESELPLSDGAQRLISSLKKLGFKTAIVSGGFQNFAEPLARRLGIDFVHANQLEVVDGELTGRVVGDIVDAERKALLLNQLAEQESLSLEQTLAVGDGANDLNMLAAAGLGVAYHAKPKVREQADVAIDIAGLDGILYVLGFSDNDLNNSQ